jgi:hypothetical protein
MVRPKSGLKSSFRFVQRTAVVAFVVWHLTVLTLRNTAGLFDSSIGDETPVEAAYQRLNARMRWYENRFAMYQAWALFTPPIARSGPFLTTRLHFADGDSRDLPSDNEPEDLRSFFRVGKARLRKHEDFLASSSDETRLGYQQPLWEQYVRWKLDRWQREFPQDPRTVEWITLYADYVNFPAPEQAPTDFTREQVEIALFAPDGTMQP